MPHDDIDHIPSIVPTRDSGPQLGRGQSRASPSERGRNSNPSKQPPTTTAGSGLLVRLTLTVTLVVAALACAWVWQLQTQLEQTNKELSDYAARISDLEARLSDTDEGMNQSAAVQAVKITELETEVRKLWDNVWKQSKERFAKLEAASASQSKSIKRLDGSLSGTQAEVEAASDDLAKLKSVAGDLARLMSSARTNQAEVERVADSLNRINLELTKLEKRVAGNEEWVASINAFRKQVNSSLSELQTTVRTMQARPQ
jgi:chromosome segregation ATPase